MGWQEHLDVLKQGAEAWREWRAAVKADVASLFGHLKDFDLSYASLPGADLRGFDLSGCNLTGSNLSGARLKGANLSGALLVRSVLNSGQCSDADLSGADMTGCQIIRANFYRANLAGAQMQEVDATYASFQGTNMSGVCAIGADLTGATLARLVAMDKDDDPSKDCDLSDAKFEGGQPSKSASDWGNDEGSELHTRRFLRRGFEQRGPESGGPRGGKLHRSGDHGRNYLWCLRVEREPGEYASA